MLCGVRGSESVARWTHSGCKGGVGAGAPTAPQRPEPRQACEWVKQVCPEGSLEGRLRHSVLALEVQSGWPGLCAGCRWGQREVPIDMLRQEVQVGSECVCVWWWWGWWWWWCGIGVRGLGAPHTLAARVRREPLGT